MFQKIKLAFVTGLCLLVFKSQGQRTEVRLTDGWEYVKGDLGGVYEALRTGEASLLPKWQKVSVPHCFNEYDAVDPDLPYYEGPGWYRTFIAVNDEDQGKRYILHFEGAGQKTKVFIYDQLVGTHTGGYDEFYIDITDAVRNYRVNKGRSGSGENRIPLVVRCDNSRDLEMIPSDLSDFNIYGGLYRYVDLITVPDISFQQIHIDTRLDDRYKQAQVTVSPEFYNPLAISEAVTVHYAVIDPSGKEVQTGTVDASAPDTAKFRYTVDIAHPVLWSVDQPQLYTLKAILETSNGKDEFIQQFGLRNFKFIPHGPFLLNGKRLFLRGTHRHEDHAGLGAAMPDRLILKEMKMIKDMGANFIRLGHYQQSKTVLNACDSLGILVWEEIPWCRGGLGNDVYKEQARRMLTNMINQHYNHPSVIIWGLGNENDWPGDFPGFAKEKIREFMTELNDLSHKLDSVRKTAIRRCDFCSDIVDVYSPSIWAGWYRGNFTEYTNVSKEWNDKVNVFLHAEWGASSHARRHSEDPDKGLESISTGKGTDERSGDFLLTGGNARVSKDGDWSETYACNLIDWHLKEQEKMEDWHVGTAFWVFKDFSTPLRPDNPIPYVNQKGVVERDLTPKESYYVFQSYWAKKPMVHLYGHTWPVRWGDRDELKMVKVYSNCDQAELFLNGKSMGVRHRDSQNFPAAGLRWMVKFREGENHLKVIARKGNELLTDSLSQGYQAEKWGKPVFLRLTEVSRSAGTVLLEAKAFDRNNIFCPDAKNRVRFSLAGEGSLIDDLGTSTGSRVIELYNGRALISVNLTGNAVVCVTSSGLEPGSVKLDE